MIIFFYFNGDLFCFSMILMYKLYRVLTETYPMNSQKNMSSVHKTFFLLAPSLFSLLSRCYE